LVYVPAYSYMKLKIEIPINTVPHLFKYFYTDRPSNRHSCKSKDLVHVSLSLHLHVYLSLHVSEYFHPFSMSIFLFFRLLPFLPELLSFSHHTMTFRLCLSISLSFSRCCLLLRSCHHLPYSSKETQYLLLMRQLMLISIRISNSIRVPVSVPGHCSVG